MRHRTISPDLRSDFRENQIRLSENAKVITLQEYRQWLIQDQENAFRLVRKRNGLSVYPDFEDALIYGKIPRDLIRAMARKGYMLDPTTLSPPKLRGNRFEITGTNRYWVNHDESDGAWSLEQVIDPALLIEVLQSASSYLPISNVYSGTLFREEGLLLSDDDRKLALRFLGKGSRHDVVLVIDNSTPAFAKPEKFRRAFREALEKALNAMRPTVRMAILWFDEDVYQVAGFTPLTKENIQALIRRLYGEGNENSPRLNFEGRLSNSPVALVRAYRELVEQGGSRAKKSILFVSEGIIDIDGKGHNRALE